MAIWWAAGDDPLSSVGYALPGVRIQLKQSNGAGPPIGVWDTDPTTGCVTVSNAYVGPYQVIVYGYATDSAGNHVRIHNGGTDTSDEYPGTTYSIGFINVFLTSGLITLKVDGAADERWTTFAAAAQTLYRYHDGIGGKTFSIGFDTPSGCQSSSRDDESNDYIEYESGYSLLKIAKCSGSNQTKTKFLVAHELGHAIGRQYYGRDGNDSSDSGFAASSCTSSGQYSMTSAEFDSVGFKEAYAHFVSARVWNNQASTGAFTWLGTTYDLENGPNNNAAGGWIGNQCPLDDDKDGVSTNYDWLRFFWDFYTQTACNSTPTKLQMQKIYYWVQQNDRSGTFTANDGSPGPSNFHDATYYAITSTLSSDFAGCTVAFYMDHACVGGRKLSGALCN